MKRAAFIFLLVFLFGFSGCNAASEQQESGGADSGGENMTDFYYDYLRTVPLMQALIDENNTSGGFDDDQMAAFALTVLITENDAAYDWEVGFSKEQFDAVTQKYFGRNIENFENNMTKIIPETGYVTATGWSFNSGTYFILKSMDRDNDGRVTAQFYYWNVSDSYVMDEPEKWAGGDEAVKQMLISGDSGLLPSLVQLVFDEHEDGGFYLTFRSAAVLESGYGGEIIPFD